MWLEEYLDSIVLQFARPAEQGGKDFLPEFARIKSKTCLKEQLYITIYRLTSQILRPSADSGLFWKSKSKKFDMDIRQSDTIVFSDQSRF